LTTNELLEYTYNETTGAFSFPLTPGHNYRLYTEQRMYIPSVGGMPQKFQTFLPLIEGE
jgi:hypothetical protein